MGPRCSSGTPIRWRENAERAAYLRRREREQREEQRIFVPTAHHVPIRRFPQRY